ncbi:hypothetical protein F4677DRAFT_406123 [Hypoxylon crocopeplum]|nr:hypothetical protein F4677DRAFT_406123 [Hypoxylon crocopeplum]
MKVSFTLVTLLAGWAMASPAVVGNLEARQDCSTCGCSSAESCTVSPPPTRTTVLFRSMLTPFSGGGSSVVK